MNLYYQNIKQVIGIFQKEKIDSFEFIEIFFDIKKNDTIKNWIKLKIFLEKMPISIIILI